MTEEHEKYLIETYSTLYNPDPKLQNNLMWFGFECGDGWFEIIRRLSDKLSKTPNPPLVLQVKQKYGDLCFYVGSATDEQYNMIHEAEEEATVTCEFCGKPGKKGGGYWVLVQCDECIKKVGLKNN